MVRHVVGVSVVLVGVVLSGFSYAQDQTSCPACEETPSDLQSYIDMMEEMIELLPITENTAVRQGEGETNALALITQDASLQEIIQTEILTPGVVKDLYIDINMANREASIQRDAEKLANIEIALINRVSAMVNAKQHIVDIPKSVATKVNTLLKKHLQYIQLKKIKATGVDDFTLSYQANATYKELAQILRHIHLMYQDLHEENWFDEYFYQVGQGYYKTDTQDIEKAIAEAEDNILKRAAHDVLTIRDARLKQKTLQNNAVDPLRYLEFTNDDLDFIVYVWEIADMYDCSLGLARNECLSDWQEMRRDISYLFKERLVSDTQRAINTFKSSWGRLKGAFGRGSSADQAAAKQREATLTESYWGEPSESKYAFWKRDPIRVSRNIGPHPIRVDALWKQIRRTRKSASNDIAGKKTLTKELPPAITLDSAAQASEQPDQNKYTDKTSKTARASDVVAEVLEERKEQYRFLGAFNKDTLTDKKAASIQATFTSILDLQNNLRTESVFNDVNRTTKRFPLLSAAVYENIQLLGKKNPTNEAEGGWYGAMSQVCELQCQNIGGKVCQHFGN